MGLKPLYIKYTYAYMKKMFKEVKDDLASWTKLPASLQTHISAIKMNVQPCMIQLSPPVDYRVWMDKLVSKYVWDNICNSNDQYC